MKSFKPEYPSMKIDQEHQQLTCIGYFLIWSNVISSCLQHFTIKSFNVFLISPTKVLSQSYMYDYIFHSKQINEYVVKCTYESKTCKEMKKKEFSLVQRTFLNKKINRSFNLNWTFHAHIIFQFNFITFSTINRCYKGSIIWKGM